MNVLSLLRQHEPALKERFGIEKIGIFGSFARGEEQQDSDVDVLVVFRAGEETFDHYMDCKFYLEDLLNGRLTRSLKTPSKYDLRHESWMKLSML